jgi:hypothetical protein
MITANVFLLTAMAIGVLGTADAIAAPTSTTNFEIGLTVRDGKAQRAYTLKLVDGSCSSIKTELDGTRDEIKICTDPAQGAKLVMRLEWMTHFKAKSVQVTSSLAVERGAKFTLDSGAAKLDVKLD